VGGPFWRIKSLATLVFLTGVAGYVVLPYTLLTNFVALEYIFLGAGLMGVSYSIEVDDFDGQVFLLCVLGVAAAEAALGLALLVQFYRLRGNVQTLMYPFVKA
jgi:NADH-quinone oxidoreductase subunit K